MRFKIDWASLIVGSKFTVFFFFFFVFEGNFPSTSPRGAYIWRGDLTKGFLRYRIGGLIHGGAYFRNFTVCVKTKCASYTSALRNTGSKRKLYLHLSTVLGALDLGYHLEVRAFYLFSQVEVPLMNLKLYFH